MVLERPVWCGFLRRRPGRSVREGMTMTEMETAVQGSRVRTTVLLDVDGVVNAWKMDRRSPVDVEAEVHEAGGYRLRVPTFMAELVQDLERRADLHWCTAWRGLANRYVSPLLGIGQLPVVEESDKLWAAGADWKLDQVLSRLVDGAWPGEVVWIEDFEQSWIDPWTVRAHLEGRVRLIDTSEYGYLREEVIDALIEEGVL